MGREIKSEESAAFKLGSTNEEMYYLLPVFGHGTAATIFRIQRMS